MASSIQDLDILVSLLDDDKHTEIPNRNSSVIHSGDTDSSDDEDNKYFESSRYNTYGKAIKNKLKENEGIVMKAESDENNYIKTRTNVSWKAKSSSSIKLPLDINKKKIDVYTEPIFGIRIINPTISSQYLQGRMDGRLAVPMAKIKTHTTKGNLKTDWVIAGALVGKSAPKVSQKGSQYLIWKLSDLKEKLQTVSVFLFGRSYDSLWKTNVGSVIGILNPNVLNNRDEGKDEATLSVYSGDQVMIWGISKDFGFCKGTKKNGEKCTSFVNMNKCEFCIYHVQTEYGKFTKRSELQSPSGGSLNYMRNKVLGKNEVFYAGKSFTSLPVVKNKKIPAKDKERLIGLGFKSLENDIADKLKPSVPSLRLNQRTNEVLKKLSLPSKTDELGEKHNAKLSPSFTSVKKKEIPSLSDPSKDCVFSFNQTTNKHTKLNVSDKNKSNFLQHRFSTLNNISGKDIAFNKNNSCQLKSGITQGTKCTSNLDLLPPKNLLDSSQNDSQDAVHENATSLKPALNFIKKTTKPDQGLNSKGKLNNTEKSMEGNIPQKRTSSKAKLKAIQFIQSNGPILKEQNKKTGKRKIAEIQLEHPLQDSARVGKEISENKGPKFSKRFLELMQQTPLNSDLLEYADLKKTEEYFDIREKKEQMEEKMLSVFKMPCKAVKCLTCHYTWFSSSEKCKADGHTIKVVDALKRFFKCGKCGNRTVALGIIPLHPCKSCGGTNWLKTSMIKERIVKSAHELSLRGGEQTFINSVETNGSLNLLVPED